MLLEEEESEEEKVRRITPLPLPPIYNIGLWARRLGVPAPERPKRGKHEIHQISPNGGLH